MGLRLKKRMRLIWERHMAYVLKQHGHSELQADYAELERQHALLQAEHYSLKSKLAHQQSRDVRTFAQVGCSVPNCSAVRYRSAKCLSHYLEWRQNHPQSS